MDINPNFTDRETEVQFESSITWPFETLRFECLSGSSSAVGAYHMTVLLLCGLAGGRDARMIPLHPTLRIPQAPAIFSLPWQLSFCPLWVPA